MFGGNGLFGGNNSVVAANDVLIGSDWRIRKNGNDLVQEVNISGTWTERARAEKTPA